MAFTEEENILIKSLYQLKVNVTVNVDLYSTSSWTHL